MRFSAAGFARASKVRPPGAATLRADCIAPLGHAEATALATDELVRFETLLRDLAPQDWSRPTVCRLWDVRQVVAHVVGAAASYARPQEFARQWNPLVQRAHRRPGFSLLDTLNQVQVDDRDQCTPEELLAELRAVGPRAIANRGRLPAPIRALRLPMPALGVVPIGYLTDVIYTRDMWIHRLDIALATAREMALDASHDRRILSLMVRDLEEPLHPLLAERSIVLDLDGRAGGRYRFGLAERAAASIRLDVTDFILLVAGRADRRRIAERSEIDGDGSFALSVIETAAVPV